MEIPHVPRLQDVSRVRVVRVLDDVPGAVYIGRKMPCYGLNASVWANPYRVGKDGTRAEVIARYRDEWLPAHPELLSSLADVHGHALACWCVPRGTSRLGDWQGVTCHGEVLAALVTSVAWGFTLGMIRAEFFGRWRDTLPDDALLADILCALVADGQASLNQDKGVRDAAEDSAYR